ncbi:MAG TPA: YebC/PmpR family DNA-binding transcriptional regulator [Oligoflexia bacterium]|nr:YebC/PmpR family DNA-binding transcriptional regulator [Oligoflexia bacterium]HMP27460.1 YebC/PmpR family DNA-binding transcriptional regulator [Oligoflexia bacterium]
MGRIFEKRKDRMFARWAKNAKAFTKIGKEIAVAVKLAGPDPNNNPRLRIAIQTARSLNMPKDKVMAAIQRARSSKESGNLNELTYEAYAPYGVALIIESATDNPTRTVGNVRSILNYHGGSLASAGALDYIFQRRGVFSIIKPDLEIDQLELELIDSGLEDMQVYDDEVILQCKYESYNQLQKALEAKKIEIKSAALQRIPFSTVNLTEQQNEDVEKLIAELEDDDDVQHVYHNIDQ